MLRFDAKIMIGFIASCLFWVGCKDKESQFSAANGQFDKSCGAEHGIAKVTLLTKNVKVGAGPQTIRYEVALEDCAGKAWPIEGEILFDLDAWYSGGTDLVLTYVIKDSVSSSQIASGSLEHVSGKDMFGKVGEGRGHNRTAGIKTTANSPKAIFEVNIGDWVLIPTSSDPSTPPGPSYTVNSFLKLGQAQAITEPIAVENASSGTTILPTTAPTSL
ncbi:MAG: hypothetical protein AB7T49_10575 [Oligoflexales bacterium]